MAAGAAAYAKWLKANRGITIPARKITRAQARAKVPGFLGHGTSDPGRRSDPGVDFDWDLFFSEFTRLMGGAVEPASSNPSTPAAKPSTGGGSVVDWLAAKGRDSSYAARARHAAQYGIKGYKDTAAQNTDLLAKLKGGAPAPAAKPKPVPAPAPAGKTMKQMAHEVIAGKHDNGHDVRRKSLGVSAAIYEKVRDEVNGRGKNIADMAAEVLQGNHGNGHRARQKSLGVDNATYARVRAEVNRRAQGATPMSKHIAFTTQSEHPWRAVIRTLLAAVIALSAMADPIYSAITQGAPAAATGLAATALAIAGAITRIMARPVVETLLQRFIPWLAAAARGGDDADPADVDDLPGYPVAESHEPTTADPDRYKSKTALHS